MFWPLTRAPRLDWLQVEVTSECPARCVYCPRHSLGERWITRRLPFELFERLAPDLRRTEHVHLQGWGEPLVHPELPAMIRLAKEAGCRVGTTTNAMLADRPTLEALVDAGLDVLALSLAGVDEHNDRIRRGTRIARVVEVADALRALREARGIKRPRLHVAYLLLRSRLADIERLPAFLARLGVDEAVLSSASLIFDPALEEECVLARDEEEFAALGVRLRAAQADAAARGVALSLHVAAPFRTPRGCSENTARAALVTSAGELVPCVVAGVPVEGGAMLCRAGVPQPAPSLAFGDLRTTTLREAWRSSAWRRFRRELFWERKHPHCATCTKMGIETTFLPETEALA